MLTTTTSGVTLPAGSLLSAPKTADTSAQGSPNTGAASSDKPNATSDKSDATDDKQNTAIAKNEPAKKMYCN